MRVHFQSRRELVPAVYEYVFKPDSSVEYVPGQYARFTFPFHVNDPHEKQHRTFTLISHPSDESIRFITRLEEPLSSYKHHLSNLLPGDVMYIDEPHGDAILPRLASTPLIFVAQGIALASYVSMLRECCLHGLTHPITLFWARRSEDDPLENLIPGEIPNLTRQDVQYPARLSEQDILPHAQPSSLLYLSGSQTFVENLGTSLEASGVLRERIIYDYYEGYTDL